MAVKTNYEKNGSHYYRARATVGKDTNGKPIRKEFYGKSKKEAEEKRDEYLRGIHAGLNINYQELTFGETMHEWLFEVCLSNKKIKPSSFQRYEGIYRLYIKDSPIYGLKLHCIKSIQIQKYYNDLYENNKSSSIIGNLHKLLRLFLNYAVQSEYLLKNPCTGVTIPGDDSEIREKEVEPFSDTEIQAIKTALKENSNQMICLMGLGTGLRQGELLALTFGDINLTSGIINVNKSMKLVKEIDKNGIGTKKLLIQTPKTKSSIRVVPIPSSLIEPLKLHMAVQKEKYQINEIPFEETSLFFTTASCSPVCAKNLFYSWSRTLKRAQVKYRKFHTLRHTYATKLFEAGVPLKTVQSLLGHSEINTTAKIYTHVMQAQKEEAVEKINDLFL